MNQELFLQRLNELIDECGSYNAFSRKTGVDRSIVREYAIGHHLPSMWMFSDILKATGVSADWLLGLKEGPKWLNG